MPVRFRPRAPDPFFPRASGPQKRFVDRSEKSPQKLRAPQKLLHELGPFQRGLAFFAGELLIYGFVLAGERVEVREREAALPAVKADGEKTVAAFLALLPGRGSADELLDAAVD